jgi:hypothetical protein
MNQLYPPANNGGKKPEPALEPTFIIEEAEEPEPAENQELTHDDESVTKEEPNSTLDRLKGWLKKKMWEVTE